MASETGSVTGVPAPAAGCSRLPQHAAGIAFKAMIAGKLTGTVDCNPQPGPQRMKAIKDYEAVKDLPVRIITAEEVFPAEVARKVLPSRTY